MGNYQGYQKYKDSGVVWLGDIPEHWEVKRFKFLLSEPFKYGANEAAEIDDPNLPRYIRITDVKDDGNLRDDTFRSLPEEIAKDYILEESDILLARSGATVGKTFIYRKSWGKAAYAGYLIRARVSGQNNSNFIYKFLQSKLYWDWVKSIFIQATIQNISAEKYSNLFITIPPLNEQEKIAQFLDYKTKQIDELIKKKETLIEKLDEKRTAIISHAVTKGLDSSVTMKDSGIEWLGDIPKHWKVIRLKHLANKITDGEHISPKNIDIGIPLLSAKDIRERYIRFDDASYVTEEDAQVFWKRCKPEKGDILIVSRGATVGRIGFVEINTKFCLMGSVILIKLNDIVYPDFIYFATNQNYVQKSIIQVSDASAQQAIYLIDVKETKFFIPPYNEQKQISKHLDQKTTQIDQQKAKIKEAIELLKEYRTSLITNAVTGKIDVSQIAIPSPQKPQPQKG
jgi:type I restriction enzyme S subunit